MTRWYRAYEGTVTDAKLAEAAMVAEVSRAVSIAAWHCLLESAAKVNNCGSYETSPRRVSVVLFEPSAAVERLFAAYEELGLIGDGVVLSWKRRQFEGDDSAERMRRYRERRKNAGLKPCADYSSFRPALVERDGESCVYCRETDGLCVDHMVPITLGGTDDTDNLALACKRCNSGKSGRTPEQAGYAILSPTAADALARYRNRSPVTVTVAAPEAETETEVISAKADSRSDNRPEVSVEQVFEGYQNLAQTLGLSVPRDLTPERRQLLRGRTTQYPLADFQTVFAKARASPFLRGDKGRTPLTFDWLFKKANFQKVLEGNYDR